MPIGRVSRPDSQGLSSLVVRGGRYHTVAMKIIVGLDGSVPSSRAVAWCASVAKPLGAEVIVVHTLDFPVIGEGGFGFAPIPVAIPEPTEADREHVRQVVAREWCAPLVKAGIPFRVVVTDGPPAQAIMALTEKESADLVVTGRRGRGGFAELVLGSTSHHLSHHLDRPLVIIP